MGAGWILFVFLMVGAFYLTPCVEAHRKLYLYLKVMFNRGSGRATLEVSMGENSPCNFMTGYSISYNLFR